MTVQLKIETILDSITDQFFALGPLGQWVENHTYPSPDGGLVALQKDITDRKRTEAALAITSPSQGIIEVNDELCRILGYEREELLRMTWTDVTHPDDLTADAASFSRVMAGEIDGYSMDKRWIRKDGRIIDSIMAARCVRRAERLRSRRPRRGPWRPRRGRGSAASRGRPHPAGAGHPQSRDERDRGDEPGRGADSHAGDRGRRGTAGTRCAWPCAIREWPPARAPRSDLRGLSYDEAPRHGAGDQPLDRRSPWRPTVGDPERWPGRDVRVHRARVASGRETVRGSGRGAGARDLAVYAVSFVVVPPDDTESPEV